MRAEANSDNKKKGIKNTNNLLLFMAGKIPYFVRIWNELGKKYENLISV